MLCGLAKRLIAVQLGLEIVNFLLGLETVAIWVCELAPSLSSGQLVSLLVVSSHILLIGLQVCRCSLLLKVGLLFVGVCGILAFVCSHFIIATLKDPFFLLTSLRCELSLPRSIVADHVHIWHLESGWAQLELIAHINLNRLDNSE